ncbi:hypothetical protein BT96DRAFT_743775, partial [Gymnopus androsaceus JB14]
IVQLLLNNGADMDAQGGKYGDALQGAPDTYLVDKSNYNSIVQLLLNNGAGVNAQRGEYGNALQAAAIKGHEVTVQLLLTHGADQNTET